jgi:hypothetical protein
MTMTAQVKGLADAFLHAFTLQRNVSDTIHISSSKGCEVRGRAQEELIKGAKLQLDWSKTRWATIAQ